MDRILPIFVTDGGEDWYDVAQKGAKLPSARPEDFGSTIGNTRPADYVTTEEMVLDYLPAGIFFLSNDHAATYPLAMRHEIAASAEEDPVGISLIVFDAHLDIYPLDQSGGLTKANVFRMLDRKAFIEKMVFVGTRPSEALILADHNRKVAEFNSEFAKDWRQGGTFEGLRTPIEVIPADSIKGFADGLAKAVALCNPENRIGIDVDLDVFEGVAGVQYDAKFGETLEKFVEQRIAYAKKNRIPLDSEKIKEIRDYACFAGNEMGEKGIRPSIDAGPTAAILEQVGGRLAFLHVTEYEQEKDKAGKTAKLANELFSIAMTAYESALASQPVSEDEKEREIEVEEDDE
jgi:hypothetical protein